jgi:hypothetical protein
VRLKLATSADVRGLAHKRLPARSGERQTCLSDVAVPVFFGYTRTDGVILADP